MKTKHKLTAFALAIVAVLLFLQHRQIQELKEVNAKSRDTLAAAGEAKPAPTSSRGRSLASVSPAPTTASIKSEMIRLAPVVRLRPTFMDLGTPPEAKDFVIQIHEMDEASLLATLQALDTMNLDGASRAWFENLVQHQLADEYPEAMLNHYRETMRELSPEGSTILEEAIMNWKETDPAAATAWLDREIAAGTFETQGINPENEMLAQFEGVVLSHRMSNDLQGTIDRLTALPLRTQIEILHNAKRLSLLSPEQEEVLTPIARELTEQIADEIERTEINPLEMWFKR